MKYSILKLLFRKLVLLLDSPNNGIAALLAVFGPPRLATPIFLLMVVYLFFLPLSIHAQQASLSISPPLIETVIKPGKSILIGYKIQNLGDPTTVKAFVTSFEPKDNQGHIQLKDTLEGPVRFNLDNADLQLNQFFFLKTNETKQLLLRMRVPEAAEEGDYYYTLLVQTEAPPTVEGNTSPRTRETIGSNILMTVSSSGIIDIQPKIAQFNLLHGLNINFLGQHWHFYESFSTIPVLLEIANKGNNVIKPYGTITLRGSLGEQAHYDVLPENILSQSQRIIDASPSATIDCSNNNPLCQQKASLLIKGFFIGKYDITTDINFGENSPDVQSHVSFIALPFKFLLGILVALVGAFFIIKKFGKDQDFE